MATQRYYKTIDGKKVRVPGVTTVLRNIGWGKDGLLYWAWQQGYDGLTLDDARRPATNVGTIVHACIEAELTKQQPPDYGGLPEEQGLQVMRALEAWDRWKQLNDFELVASEWVGVHPGEGLDYGGTLDLAMVQGHPVIADFKTSKAIYSETLCQLVAYGKMWETAQFVDGIAGSRIDEYQAIRFGKDDGSLHHHVWPAASLEPAWEAFKHALGLHRLARVLKDRV